MTLKDNPLFKRYLNNLKENLFKQNNNVVWVLWDMWSKMYVNNSTKAWRGNIEMEIYYCKVLIL